LKKLNSESDKTSECYITNCYYNNTGLPSCASTTPPTVDSSKALTDSEMQSASSFVGFDFNTVWEIGVTDGYPYPTLQNNPHIGNGSTVSKIPDDAVYFNGSYYKLYTITSSNKGSAAWNEALKHCEELGGHLAVINSQEENDFLYSYITSLGISTAYFGYTDEETENTWVWVTGEENTYTNWHTGEPNRENTNEDYASFYWKFTDGTWNDGNMGAGTNSDDRSYLCEWNATPTPPSVSGITIQCGDPVDYAGNTRIFTVIFAEKPTSAYLQFDNQYDPSKWLDDAYCASNVLFRIKPDEIVEKDGQYVYKTEFRIHSEGLESQNYMRKVRVCAEYSGTTTLSEAVSFQVNPLPVRETGNTIGYLYEQTIYDGTADTPAILNVTNTAGTGEDRILSVVNYSCDDAATPFFWWEADCGTFYEIAGDFTTVGFIPSSSGTVTVYMGDGLGYVTSYELTIEN